MRINVPPRRTGSLDSEPDNDHEVITDKIKEPRKAMLDRYGIVNKVLQGGDLSNHYLLKERDHRQLEPVLNKLDISILGCLKIIRLASKIADYSRDEYIAMPHLGEALNYRQLDGYIELF